jgi:Tfp pilus assembly protein PilV
MGGAQLTGPRLDRRSEAGISMIEVMISSLILTVSLLAVAAAMGQGIKAMNIVQEQLIAKQKARETLESVFTSRSTQNVTFDQIQSEGDGGIFLDGFQAVRGMGVDGIANTDDDAATPIETISLPGPDGLLDTADDETRTLTNYTRKVTFSEVLLPSGTTDEDIRKVTVEVRFVVNGHPWTVSVSSLISRYA